MVFIKIPYKELKESLTQPGFGQSQICIKMNLTAK